MRTDLKVPFAEKDAAKASAVLEVLDEIREWIWLVHGSQIQQELRRDCAVTKAANLTNLSDEDVPF